MHGQRGLLVVFAPHVDGDDDVGADGQAREQVNKQVDDGGACSHAGKRGVAEQLAAHHGVSGVEELLQEARHGERQRENQDVSQKGALGHVHLTWGAGPFGLCRRCGCGIRFCHRWAHDALTSLQEGGDMTD